MKSEDTKSNFPIDRLIDDKDKEKLYETMISPGWQILRKFIVEVQLDWADQFLGRSLSNLSAGDEELFKDLLHKKGMRDGIIKLFNALHLWQRAMKKEKDSDKK